MKVRLEDLRKRLEGMERAYIAMETDSNGKVVARIMDAGRDTGDQILIPQSLSKEAAVRNTTEGIERYTGLRRFDRGKEDEENLIAVFL